jgi:hypothetical protein
VVFEQFVGIAPRLYMALFDITAARPPIKRKDEFGNVLKWKAINATLRDAESTEQYLWHENLFLSHLDEILDNIEKRQQGGTNAT